MPGEYDSYRIRAFPINTPKIRGHWYIRETKETGTENPRWNISQYTLQTRMQQRSLWAVRLPREAEPLLSLHGITVFPRAGQGSSPISLRLDYRTSQDELPISLNRQSWSSGAFPPDNDDLSDAMLRILVDHFDEVNADWRYRQMVASTLNMPWSVIFRIPDCVRVMTKSGEWQTITIEDMT